MILFLRQQLPIITLLLFVITLGAIYQIFVVPAGETVFLPHIMAEFLVCAFVVAGISLKSQMERGDLRPFFENIIIMAVVYVVLVMFSNQKSLISYVVPYGFDVLWAQIDKLVHFGQYPHELLRVMAWPQWLIVFVDRIYASWFLAIYLWMLVILLFQTDIRMRQANMIAFCMIWIVSGNIAATFASSVGPTFWAEYYPAIPNPYAFFITHLENVNAQTSLFAMMFKGWILDLQNNNVAVDANAPSAMPSLHVGLVWLIFLSVPPRLKWLRAGVFLYAMAIIIGSVALGWHYGIDAYAAMLLSWGIYFLIKTGVLKYHGSANNRQTIT